MSIIIASQDPERAKSIAADMERQQMIAQARQSWILLKVQLAAQFLAADLQEGIVGHEAEVGPALNLAHQLLTQAGLAPPP